MKKLGCTVNETTQTNTHLLKAEHVRIKKKTTHFLLKMLRCAHLSDIMQMPLHFEENCFQVPHFILALIDVNSFVNSGSVVESVKYLICISCLSLVLSVHYWANTLVHNFFTVALVAKRKA